MPVPDAPTITAPADNAAIKLTDGVDFAWTHNDPESDPQAGWAIKRRRVDLPSALGNGLQVGSEEWWSDTAQEVLSGPTTVITSASSTATAYSNQRKIDRCQNGVLWAMSIPYTTGASGTVAAELSYSTDGGGTWASGGSIPDTNGSSYQSNASFFIDLDDYAHVTYKGRADGYIYYRRGTPNTERTAWTWSAATAVWNSSTGVNYPDVVAHREGTGWRAHVVASYISGASNQTSYWPVTISSGGVVSVGSQVNFTNHANGADTYPSIDFNHTGDGKTVAGSTPHLYAAWSAGGTGSGKGIRFKKATYSGGTWTWGTEREIDNARYVTSGGDTWLNCLFDGTRVILVGSVYDGTNADLILHDRDAADTATAQRTLIENTSDADRLLYGSATYDADGNVYLFGRHADEAVGSNDLVYVRWVRSGATLDAEVVLDSAVGSSQFITAKRGFSGSKIEWIYTDGTASPYNVNYGSILLAPANSWVPAEVTNAGTASTKTITDWPADTDTYQYAIATADSGGLGAYSAWRTLNPFEFWRKAYSAYDGSAGPTTVTTSTSSTATAYSNGRLIDRCSNGVLWAVRSHTAGITPTDVLTLSYSLDDGETWNAGGSIPRGNTTTRSDASPSFFIDQDDYAHLVYFAYDGGGSDRLHYRRGTPNAGRTSWTWSSPSTLSSGNGENYPDVVAHRQGTGWVAHVVWSAHATSSFDRVKYHRITIASDGTINPDLATDIRASHANTNPRWPSIDFNHTGDGKTVAGGTPHLYVAWSSGATGAGSGIRFMKATYSGGTWTWGTEREIDSARYIDAADRWLNCMFDGTRVVLVGWLWDGSNRDLVIYERDAADTNTTTTELLANAANTAWLQYGSSTYDGDGNIHLFGLNEDEAAGSRDLVYRKWTRSGSSLGAEVVIDTAASNSPYVSVKRGFSGSRIEFIYTDGTASPYNVNYGAIVEIDYPEGWVPMVEVVNIGTENSLVWPIPVEKGTYQWSAATGDPYSAYGPYAATYLLIVGGGFERWGMAMI